MTFRDDLSAASDWVAAYLEGAGARPVVPTVSPGAIRAAILAAAPGATEIGDRAEAIRAGIAGLEAGDVLLVAGKGHETGQIVGGKVLPFSDHEAVAKVLKDLAR